MSVSSGPLPKLQHAKFEEFDPDEISVQYKSGAIFKGTVCDHRREGSGKFTWPNGAQYEGEYQDNLRNGKGLQVWQDGSQYDGDFVNDKRHGEGEVKWSNNESYKGPFYKDRRHGKGVYNWPDGSTYTGTFYMDRKEGYGVFKFANGNKFEGLYKEDEREGPGVLTYHDGKQDVGLWKGEKLVKLCTANSDAFTMDNHKELDFNPEEHVMYLNTDELTDNADTARSEDILELLPDSQITERVTDLYSDSLDPRSLAINREEFDKEYFRQLGQEKNDKNEKVLAWNRTPSVINLQKHVLKHKGSQNTVSFKVDQVLKGERSKFKVSKGPLETASEELLGAAAKGDLQKVEDLLTGGKVHPDVADNSGHTALIGAAVNWQVDVINCLLNHGADVNKLNGEGCSALSAGAIFFYPLEGFRYNIAERYLDRPAVYEEKDRKAVKSQKGILATKKTPGSTKSTPAPPKQKGRESPAISTDKKVVPSGTSLISADSGFAQNDSNQNLSGKQQVRIVEPEVNGSKENIKENDSDSVLGDASKEVKFSLSGEDHKTEESEFESVATLRDFEIEVSEQLLERCATQLSTNEKIVGGRRSRDSAMLGTVRHMAVIKNEKERMKATLDLLLRRGADPNASGVPMPILFFAIKSADVEMVKTLLYRGASTAITLPKEKGGLAPLHIACAIPGDEGVQITELLLHAGAEPDVRATMDDSFLNRNLEEEWNKDTISPESELLLGGRTPLHIACARDDNYKNACKVVHLLLEHKANPNLLCNGFSPLALAIASGNDQAIDVLLAFLADPSLVLTHGVGSALCVAASTEYEYRRPITTRLALIDKLVKTGGNILAPIPIGPKRIMGTAVDYAYYMFNQDRRIAHMPYHALTHAERDTYNARKKLLEHLGDILRTKAVERERFRLEDDNSQGIRSRSPSPNFVYTGAGAELPPGHRKSRSPKSPKSPSKSPDMTGESKVKFEPSTKSPRTVGRGYPEKEPGTLPPRKPLFKYCYECGRSVGVRLSACTRCKEVYYCSKACKIHAWDKRHKQECVRIGDSLKDLKVQKKWEKAGKNVVKMINAVKLLRRSRSPSPKNGRKGKSDSPTPNTDLGKGKLTVNDINKDKKALRISVPNKGLSTSARGKREVTILGVDPRKIRSEKGQRRRPNYPPWVYVDNYSYV
ncbi:ankyrin repeat and MYND domain-containing protein 1-like isoform X1 [Mytilus californianus]|uniref:ankyrin repeat and MYND domain-containing protein 1-like isoform X1 n=1 Tax=Mytilus californianus TaxID=6549 RepID=UPI0022463E75|nr:ankyrin repeat and MYND domain-containing protein 1-like isoform X1 [Mytilus californianus]